MPQDNPNIPAPPPGFVPADSATAAPTNSASVPPPPSGFVPVNQTESQPQPQFTASAVPQPTTLSGKLERWAQNVTDDLKYGTDLTGIGTVLKKMGAHGVYSGNSEGVGDFVASLPLGLLRGIKGEAELTQSGKRWQGTKDVVGGALQASTIPASFVAPEAAEVAAGKLGEAGNAVSQAASKAKQLIAPAQDVKLQMTKDAIRHVLGTKADADVLDEAADRIGKTKLFSNVENELKLVKPQLDTELKTMTSQLDDLLAKSPAQVPDAAHEVNKVMDQMIANAKAGVGDSEEAQKAINTVRSRVVSKLGDQFPQDFSQPIPAKDLNQVKRLVGDEIRKFSIPENLTSMQKWEQEAYRQAYFRLRDMVSEAVPATKELNGKISKGIQLQDLLEKKFPHLQTPQAAQASYSGTRATNLGKTAVKVGKAIAVPAGLGTAYELGKNVTQ